MYQNTKMQEEHSAQILARLCTPQGAWVGGKELGDLSGSANLSARLGSLKAAGWKFESRPDPAGLTDFYDYRIVGKGEPPGRRAILTKLKAHPEGRAWKDYEVEELEDRFAKAMDAYIDWLTPDGDFIDLFEDEALLKANPTEPDWFDMLTESK